MDLSRLRTDTALTGAVFVALVIVLLRTVSDYDIWYHLAIGREIVARGAIPDTEFLVFGLASQPASFHEWGFALLFFAAHELLGPWGIALLNSALAAATFTALYLAARAATPTGSRPLLLLVLLGAALIAQFRLVYRPEMMLFLALGITVLVMERYRAHARRRELAWLPLISLVLTQCHPSVLFVLVVFGAYAFERIVTIDAARRAREAGWLTAAGIGTALAAMVNPYGWQQLVLPLAFAGEREYLQTVTEFLPALQTPFATEFIVTLLVAALALALARPRRIAHVVLFAVFGWLAFRHVRNLTLLALVMYVPVAVTTTALAARVAKSAVARQIMWAFVLAVAVGWTARTAMLGIWGAGVAPATFPEQAAAYLSVHRPPGRVFNFYDTGGYLAWRLGGPFPVFIDGRHYGLDVALQQHDAVFSAAPTWDSILAAHKIGAIVTPTVLRYSGAPVPLVLTLSRDPRWALVAIDSGAALFVLRAFAREPLPVERVWLHTLADAQRVLDHFPDQHDALFSISVALHELGQTSDAIATLQRYLERAPDNAVARQALRNWSAP